MSWVGGGWGTGGWRWRALGLFGVPVVFFEWAAGSLPDVSRSAGLAMVPVVVVLVVASAEGAAALRLLAPAVVGLSGVLFLLPLDLPDSVRGRLMLGGLVLVVGAGYPILSDGMHRFLRGVVVWRMLSRLFVSRMRVLLMICCLVEWVFCLAVECFEFGGFGFVFDFFLGFIFG